MTAMISLKHVDKAALVRMGKLVGQIDGEVMEAIRLKLESAPEYDPYNRMVSKVEILKQAVLATNRSVVYKCTNGHSWCGTSDVCAEGDCKQHELQAIARERHAAAMEVISHE